MKFSCFNSLVACGTTIVFSLCLPSSIQAQATCTTNTFSGTYLYILSGFTFTKKAEIQVVRSRFPFLVTGRIVLKGDGTGRGQQTVNGNNEVTDQSFFTSYTVDSNCQGELLLAPCTSAGCIGLPLHFALARDGKEAFVVNGDEKTTLSGQFIKVPGGRSCNQATLNGDYRFQTFGFGFDPSQPILTRLSVPFTSAGVQEMADGAFTASDWANFGGSLLTGPRTYTISYTVNSDCTADIAASDTSLGARIYAAGDGSVFTLIQTPGSAPVAGWYKRQ